MKLNKNSITQQRRSPLQLLARKNCCQTVLKMFQPAVFYINNKNFSWDITKFLDFLLYIFVLNVQQP